MEKENLSILELIPNPGFCVRDNRIIKTNLEAKNLSLAEGEEIAPRLCTGQEEYAAFTGGWLTLTLRVGNAVREATVTRMEDMDVFLVEAQTEAGELRALALAARELRGPLSVVSMGISRLTAGELRPENREAAAEVERGLYRLLRLIGNVGRCPWRSGAPDGNAGCGRAVLGGSGKGGAPCRVGRSESDL